MPTLTEGGLTFDFPDGWRVEKFGAFAFYAKRFQSACGGGIKEMDFVAIEPKACCWLIEVKDYRRHPRTKSTELADEIAEKVFDTLAGLLACQWNANDAGERDHARQAVRCPRVRVVLHVEQPVKPSRLFPRPYKLADLLDKLRIRLRAIDPHLRVVERADLAGIPWVVS